MGPINVTCASPDPVTGALQLAFRGGTTLYKLYLKHAARYSEDNLVKISAEPAGPLMDARHEVLDPWARLRASTKTNGRPRCVPCHREAA